MPEGVLGVEKRGTNNFSYFLSISSSNIINYIDEVKGGFSTNLW